MARVAPKRLKLRRDRDAPILTKSNNDKLEPMRANPNTDKVLPKRKKLLSDTDAPRWTQSNTDNDDDKRAIP
jgi:hypothetical protein